MTRFKYGFFEDVRVLQRRMKSKLIFTNPATNPPPRTNADVYAPPATPVLALTCLHISSMTSSSDLENSTCRISSALDSERASLVASRLRSVLCRVITSRVLRATSDSSFIALLALDLIEVPGAA